MNHHNIYTLKQNIIYILYICIYYIDRCASILDSTISASILHPPPVQYPGPNVVFVLKNSHKPPLHVGLKLSKNIHPPPVQVGS